MIGFVHPVIVVQLSNGSWREAPITAPKKAENPLAKVLRDYWTSERPHHERLVFTAAVISTALQREGMRATLVGGGAIELHAPGIYHTTDIDLVVEGRGRAAFGAVLESLGLRKTGRHWVMDDLYVEVSSIWMESPVEVIQVERRYDLRVIRKEWILGERIAGFRHWKYWASGMEAIRMIRAFGEELDEAELSRSLKIEGTGHAYALLRSLADSEQDVTTSQLDALWHANYR